MSARKQLEKEIREAYIFLRTENQSIPSETLQFMLDASLEKLETLKDVSETVEEKPLSSDWYCSTCRTKLVGEIATFVGWAECPHCLESYRIAELAKHAINGNDINKT